MRKLIHPFLSTPPRIVKFLRGLFAAALLFACIEFSIARFAYAEVVAQQTMPTAQPEEEQGAVEQPTFTGRWYTHIAIIDLEQEDDLVTGSVAGYDGFWTFDITGIVDGNLLTVRASEVLDEFVLTLSEDGAALGGDPEDPMRWCGVRATISSNNAGPNSTLPDGCGYSGTWSIYSGDETVPPGGYLQLTQEQGAVTGSLLALDETLLQTIEGEVQWGKGYSLEVAEGELLGSMLWMSTGNAFGTTRTGDAYELQINLSTHTYPFVSTAYNPSRAPFVDREDSPLDLPAPLYFLNASGQIMRLDPTEFEAVQLTDEATPITSFDVAYTHGGLVYVVDEQLIELDLVSGDRTMLVAETVTSAGEPEDAWTERLKRISQPRYAPDGTQIVYLHDGLWLIESHVMNQLANAESANADSANADSTNADSADADSRDNLAPSPPQLMAANQWINEDYSNAGEIRLYNQAKWSPSGSYLLVSFGVWEGSATEVWDVTNKTTLFDKQFWVPCCDAIWGENDETVVAASNAVVYGQPGLFQLDIERGELTTLLNGNSNQSQLSLLARGAHQSQDGELYALLNQTTLEQLGSEGDSYVLHQLSESGELTLLNSGGVSPSSELLWAEDDSGLLLVDRDGVLQWLPVDGETVTNLFIIGSNLRWGGANAAVEKALAALPTQTYPSASLQKQAAIDFDLKSAELDGGLTVEELDSMVSTRHLVRPKEFASSGNNNATSKDDDPLWVAHSTDLRDFDQETGHWIALYTQDGADWQLVEQIQFPFESDDQVQPGPDYVGANSVKPQTLSHDRYWLSLEGGVGAHSSLYYLLSFDGEALTIESEAFSSAAGAGWLEDTNYDGLTDYFVADASDYYVFCYACGVRRVQYSLSRWDGDEMVPAKLTLLDEENISAAVTPELRDLNNLMVQFAQAGLWQDVQELMPVYSEMMLGGSAQNSPQGISPRVAILDDNMAFIRLHLNDIQQEVYNSDAAYPLLANIFFGDYRAALERVRPLSMAEVFSPNSSLIADTAAEGWEEALAQNILISTDAALVAAPQRAEPHFFIGWSNWLLGDDEAAIAALTEAINLAPTDLVYRNALATLQPGTGSTNQESLPLLRSITGMNLRTGPGTQYEKAGSMPAGTAAPLLGKSVDGEWWLIWMESSAQQLWVSANPAFTTAENAQNVPISGFEEPVSEEPEDVESEDVESEDAEPDDVESDEESGSTTSPPTRITQLDDQAAVLAISQNDTLLATGGVSGVHVWETTNWTLLWTEDDNPEDESVWVKALALNADGTRLIIGRDDGAAHLLDATTGQLIADYSFSKSVESVDFNADGSIAAMGSFDGDLIVADAESGTVLAELDNELPVQNLALSPDGPWVAAMTAGSQVSAELVIWDFLTNEQRSLASHNRLPNLSNVSFSPNTKWVAGALQLGDPVRVWETEIWSEIVSLEVGDDSISQLLFDSTNTQLAALISASAGSEIVVWDVPSWSESARISLPDVAWEMAFSPDGRFIVVGLGQDSTNEAQLWEIATGSLAASFPQSGQVTSIAFSHNGQWIAAGGGTSNVQIWSMDGLLK